MIHRITLPLVILRDYETRGVFTRFTWSPQHPMMDDISAKLSSDELRIMLLDAEQHSPISVTGNPNLTRAYVRFAEKAREQLRKQADETSVGRDGKSAAAHDYD